MTGLFLWAAVSVGTVIGIPIGWVICWPRAHADGVAVGLADAARWNAFLSGQGPEYQQTLPHGSPAHVCTFRCLPPRG